MLMLAIDERQITSDYYQPNPELDLHPLLQEGVFSSQTIEGEVPIAGTDSRYILEIPDNPVDDTVNVIVYGFAGSEPAYRGLAKAMAEQQGLITLRCKLSRTQKIGASLHPSHLFNPMALSSKIVRGAIGALPDHGLDEKVNLFGHSMGGYIGTHIAHHKPHLVERLTLFSSAGLIEHSPRTLAPGVPKLLGRLASDILELDEFKPSPGDALHCLKHIVRNPILTLGEMIIVGKCDIRNIISQLDPSVKLAILQARNDELFDLKEVVSQVANSTDNFRVVDDVGHASPITHPSLIAREYADLLRESSDITERPLVA